MPRIRAHSSDTPWIPRSDADIDKADRTRHQRKRADDEAKMLARVAKYRAGMQVGIEYRFISGERLVIRGVLVQIVPWSVDRSVLVAYVEIEGEVRRVDAMLLRRAR